MAFAARAVGGLGEAACVAVIAAFVVDDWQVGRVAWGGLDIRDFLSGCGGGEQEDADSEQDACERLVRNHGELLMCAVLCV